MQSRNQTVDVLRLLAALEVIVLHAEFSGLPDSVGVALRLQARWAVPFFFILSGYFLGGRLADPARSDVRPTIYRLIWIFGLWSVIHIPLVLYQHEAKEVFRRLLLPSFIYVGTYFHLWFPSSLVLGFLVVLFCLHYGLERYMPFVCALILTHALLAGSYDVFGIKFPFDFETARHWVSVPLMYLGLVLWRRGPLPRLTAAALLFGGLALQAVEAYLLLRYFGASPYNHEILIGTVPFAIGVASLGLSGLKLLDQQVLSGWGRTYSLGIYLSHALVAAVLGIGVNAITIPAAILPLWQLVYPVLICIVCLVILAAIRARLPQVFAWLLGEHAKPE